MKNIILICKNVLIKMIEEDVMKDINMIVIKKYV